MTFLERKYILEFLAEESKKNNEYLESKKNEIESSRRYPSQKSTSNIKRK